MRMTKVPYESKYRKILAEARDYIREYQEYRERQRALGLWVEDDASKRENDPSRKTSFVSEETENALKDAKQKLAEVLQKSNGASA